MAHLSQALVRDADDALAALDATLAVCAEPLPPSEADYDDDWDNSECGNCGGEGWTYNCIDGCCVNAEDGCELCASRCDWCNPRPPKEHAEGKVGNTPIASERNASVGSV